ncbi:MAG: site-2 protease family protein [Magnetospirillum sp.]|nr:site-2 protease family protein [Magnetospirillum sp.]
MTDVPNLIYGLSIWALPLVFAVTLHEAAHGYAALAMGDDTARRMGRLSLNPLRHIDPVGTILVPAVLLAMGGMLFGWAKPVPVNFGKLRNLRLGMILVAAAGPATNILLAIAAILLVRLVPYVPQEGRAWFFVDLDNLIVINLLLAVFNMSPLPPLDGGRVLVGLLPRALAWRVARLENVGLLILLAGMFMLPPLGRAIGVDLDIFQWIFRVPVDWLADLVMQGFGPRG